MHARMRALVLDVEGTTTPISFVYETLFPYARKRLRNFVESNWDRLDEVIQAFQKQAADDLVADHPLRPVTGRESLIHNALAYMDQDLKVPCLKTLQGLIWEEGYRDGSLKGEVFSDVKPAFQRWSQAGLKLAIYSSGSVFAQRLLFGNSSEGDLTRYISDYFDTEVGAKREAESYRRIAARLGLDRDLLLFATDVVAEAEAAHEAGLEVVLLRRPGNPDPGPHPFPEARDFTTPPFP